ncbi:MAG: DNA gyrase subunit A [Clostridiales bacterium]|nr:DNA gyrase subunit A [Clostridiales bacterium]
MEQNNRIIDIDIESEVKKSFISYAMAVNISRALPDVRDGLKPVHRRILYSMYESGYTFDKPTRKSARIVGDVMGKYHPHGDSSIYDALVRLAQPFSIRYTLAYGQGNFGTVDGDPAAASRYTEAKLSKIAGELLADIDKETVDFYPNFDETEMQPRVLPSRFPNLMVNGSDGIAVGMATNIPPHNLREVIDGVVALIENADISIEELMEHIKGPDFPTAAQVMGVTGIRDTYLTGRGRIVIRAKHEIEQITADRQRIVITEIPYQVNKARLIERIAELHKDKAFEGLSDLRDESNKEGMRIVLELKKDVNPQVVLNFLYKHTQLQDSFGAIMLALVDGEPRVLNLKEMLYYYLEHQKEVVTRRTQYDLNKALARAHLVEGFLRALDIIDTVIALIRSSQTTEIARNRLMEELNFSLEQAKSILDMRLQRLTGLEKEKLQQEFDELQKNIAYFRAILASPQMVLDIIKEELLVIKDKYGDDRRTEITFSSDEIDLESLIQQEDMVVTMTHFGYIKRVPADTYRAQNRGGKGITGITTRDEDFVERVLVSNTHTDILFFTTKGRVFQLRCYQIPEAGRTAKGSAIVNLLNLDGGEKVTTVIALPEGEENRQNMNLVMATRQGFIKKTALSEYNIRKNGLIAIVLREGDELVNVELSNGENDVLLATNKGKAIRFEERLVRNMSRATMGVTAINLQDDDYVVNMAVIKDKCEILTITENGYGKRTDVDEYRVTGRNCKGIITHNINELTGNIVDMAAVNGEEDIMLITNDGIIIRTKINQIRTMGRSTQGVRVMRVKEGVKVVAIATAPHEEDVEVVLDENGQPVILEENTASTETAETQETL